MKHVVVNPFVVSESDGTSNRVFDNRQATDVVWTHEEHVVRVGASVRHRTHGVGVARMNGVPTPLIRAHDVFVHRHMVRFREIIVASFLQLIHALVHHLFDGVALVRGFSDPFGFRVHTTTPISPSDLSKWWRANDLSEPR